MQAGWLKQAHAWIAQNFESLDQPGVRSLL
jgi:hypothetical protein